MGIEERRRVLLEKGGTPIGDLPVGTVVKLKEQGIDVEYIVVNQGIPSSMYDSSCDGAWVLRKDIHSLRQWDDTNNNYKNSDIHSWLTNAFIDLLDCKDSIKQVKIPYWNGTGLDGSNAFGSSGLSTKVFLLGGQEVGFSNAPSDGAVLSYFNGASDSKRIAYLNGSAAGWGLRSPSTNNTNRVWSVGSSGDYYYYGLYYYSYGIRPAFILPYEFTDYTI